MRKMYHQKQSKLCTLMLLFLRRPQCFRKCPKDKRSSSQLQYCMTPRRREVAHSQRLLARNHENNGQSGFLMECVEISYLFSWIIISSLVDNCISASVRGDSVVSGEGTVTCIHTWLVFQSISGSNRSIKSAPISRGSDLRLVIFTG